MTPFFHIGDFRVDPDLNRIVQEQNGHGPVQVEPKVMDVLVCLHAARGEVVLRDRILSEVWGETIVGPDVLTRAVGQLRKALGDDSQSPRFIETIPRRGYRLLATTDKDSPAPPPKRRRVPLPIFFGLAILAGVVISMMLRDTFVIAERVVRPTRVFPVTSAAGKEIDPAVSPDGTHIAFAARPPGSAAVNLHVHELATGQTRQLTFLDGHAQHPSWAPDGRTLAFVREDNLGVFTVPAEGGIPERVADCGHPEEHGLAWAPDGRGLIMAQQNEPGAPAQLVIVDIATGDARQLTDPDLNYEGDFDPALSPNGRSVAFIRVRTSGAQDIYVAPLGGGEVRRLTFDSQPLTGLDWSADGKHIIYSSMRAGVYALWQVDLEGGLPYLILGGGDKIKDPGTARTTDLVAFENWAYETNIWRQDLNAGTDGYPRPELLVRSNQWDLQPSYSPDGHSLAFVSTRNGASQLWLADADGSNPRRRTDFTESRVGIPRWAPDGSRLAITVMEGGQTDVFVIPAEGGPGFTLTSDPLDDLAPAWSRDGSHIYFTSRRSGSWQVWRKAIDDGTTEMVTVEGGFASAESADGQYLIFTRTDEIGLWEKPLAGGPARQILDGLYPGEWGNWAVTATGVCFVEHTEDGTAFARWDRASNQVFKIVEVDSLVGQGLTVSPDGRWLAYSRVDKAECDILAAEGFR